MLKSSNPFLKKVSQASVYGSNTQNMTVQGTINKTAILFVILLIAAMSTWQKVFSGIPVMSLVMVGGIGGFIVAMITSFKPEISMYTAPIYALLEGLLIGAISAMFEMAYHGIVIQAIMGTLCVFGVMLFLYKARIIRVTEKMKMVLMTSIFALIGIFIFSIILRLFGMHIPGIYGNGPIGIGFSLLIIVLAAFFLMLDFDMIEKGAQHGAPKYMEWYCGFSLLITLVWLYMEILRLLSKLNDR